MGLWSRLSSLVQRPQEPANVTRPGKAGRLRLRKVQGSVFCSAYVEGDRVCGKRARWLVQETRQSARGEFVRKLTFCRDHLPRS